MKGDEKIFSTDFTCKGLDGESYISEMDKERIF